MIEEWRKNTAPTTVGWKIAQVPYLRIPRRIDSSWLYVSALYYPLCRVSVSHFCLVHTWAEAFKGNTPMKEKKKQRIRAWATQMFLYFVKCVEESRKGSTFQSFVSRVTTKPCSRVLFKKKLQQKVFIGISSNLPWVVLWKPKWELIVIGQSWKVSWCFELQFGWADTL